MFKEEDAQKGSSKNGLKIMKNKTMKHHTKPQNRRENISHRGVRKRTRWMKCEGRQKSNLKQDIMFQSYPVHTEKLSVHVSSVVRQKREGQRHDQQKKTERYYMNIIKTRKRKTRQNLLSKKIMKNSIRRTRRLGWLKPNIKKTEERKKSLSDSCQ